MAALGDWSPEEFAAAGHEVLELIRDHLAAIDDVPVLGRCTPEELRALLAGPLPEVGVPFDRILADTRERVIPHLTHWNHPKFFAYFPSGTSGPGIVADTLISALNVNAMLWKTSPAASALEQVVLGWLAELAGYDPGADGVLVNGASLATFYALAAAREELGLGIREQGMAGRDLPVLRVYCTDQAHSSVDKAVIALGVGLNNLVKVESDAGYRMRPDRLAAAVAADRERGYRPFAVVAVAGTTSTGAVDPLADVAAVCRDHGLWLHVDAAYGGLYNILPEIRAQADLGVGDSLVINPHKVLFTPLEVTALFSRRGGRLAAAFSLVPEYLRTDRPEGTVDYMDFSLQLGRSFRALKLWWVIRSFGRSGLAARMAEQLRLARWLHEQAGADPGFRLVGGSPYPLVCLQAFPADLQAAWAAAEPAGRAPLARYRDRLNALVMERVNQGQAGFISHTVVQDGYVLRVAVGNLRTEERHVAALWEELQRAAVEEDRMLRPGLETI